MPQDQIKRVRCSPLFEEGVRNVLLGANVEVLSAETGHDVSDKSANGCIVVTLKTNTLMPSSLGEEPESSNGSFPGTESVER